MEVLASEAVTRLELVEAQGETLVGACHRRDRLLFFARTAVARLVEPLRHQFLGILIIVRTASTYGDSIPAYWRRNEDNKLLYRYPSIILLF